MRRRAPTERVEPFRSRQHESAGHELRDRLNEWAQFVGPEAGVAWPELPVGVVDRPAEVWEPLVAVADAAGGEWPRLAREACRALCSAPKENQVSLGVRLLSDIRKIFGDAIALHTATILERLCSGTTYTLEPDAPWNELHGRPLGERGLASMLKRYGVSSIKVKIDGRSLQGYRREALWDVWQRYLPPPPEQAEPAEPEELRPEKAGSAVPEVPQVPVPSTPETGGEVICSNCQHFKAGSNGHGLGSCLKYGTDAAPSTPFTCPGFEERSV
jgi:hypothetical protein